MLTDENTGLSTTYAFYSFSYGVSGGFSNVKVYDEEGNAPGDKIQEVSLSDSITRFSSNIDKVRIGFDGSAAANEERLVELVDGNGRVLQSFISASGDKPVSQTFLSDVIQLKEGLNCLLLRYQGVDNSKREDGKPVETPAYKTKALVINYVDPNNDDPALIDTVPEKMELFVKGVQDSAPATALQELTFQWKEKAETTPARWESTVELSPDDFNLGEKLEYLSQVIHLCVDLKDGQEITVTGGNETPQPRTLLPDGSYHVADYYESFGSANKPTVMKKDAFTVTITVTAKDGIHKDTYFITVNKSGCAALVVPKIYQSRELLIVADRPIRNVLLPFDAVSITDAEGLPVNTARALEDGTLKIQITDPAVVSWDGEARNSGSIAVDLLKQGKTDIKLVYDDGALHLDGTTVLYVNYKINVLADARSDAADLWTDAKNGKREYEDGAVDALKDAIQAANTVYDKYKDKDRRLMNQTQFDEINDAVNDLREAIKTFQYKEIGVKIVEFPGWPEDYDLPESVSYNEKPSNFTPKTLIGKDVDGKEHEIKVTWSCKPTWDSTEWDEKNYTFTAVLEPGYVPAEDVEFPTFVVLRELRPLCVKLSKNQVKFPSACPPSGGKATTAILSVYPGTELVEIYNPDNPNGKPGAPGLGLETSVRDGYTTWLPTEWLKVPDNFSSENVGDTFEFQFTLKPGKGDDWVEYDWSSDVPEDQKIYTMIVQIVDPPTLTVTGLEDTKNTVVIKGTKTDTVFGEPQDPVQIDTITLGPNNWSYVLSDRGEKLVPLMYDFKPQEIEDYIAGEPYQSGGNWVIKYTKINVESLTLSPTQLILPVGGWSRLSITEQYKEPTYERIALIPENDYCSINPLGNGAYKVTGITEGKTTVKPVYDEEVKSITPCVVIVLPDKLKNQSLKVGETISLTNTEAGALLNGLEVDWSSDESIATVDKNGVVTAIKEGETTITATVQTDNLNSPRTAAITCTITVTPTDPGGGGGGGGTLSGQTTSGGGDYRDLLTDPLPQQGSNGTNNSNANTAQGARRPQAGTSQTTGQKSETTTDAAGNGGDDAGSGTTGRVISVSKGDKSPGSAKELAVILISCSVLLAAGIFRGKKRGED